MTARPDQDRAAGRRAARHGADVPSGLRGGVGSQVKEPAPRSGRHGDEGAAGHATAIAHPSPGANSIMRDNETPTPAPARRVDVDRGTRPAIADHASGEATIGRHRRGGAAAPPHRGGTPQAVRTAPGHAQVDL